MNALDPKSALFQFQKHPDALKYPVRLLGVRGWDLMMGKKDVNDNGIYDDLISICVSSAEPICESFRASTDPGKYYIERPMNEMGCARLRPGLFWYKMGSHKGHPAFVQAAGVDVERLNSKGEPVHMESNVYIGANIHSGGPGYEVDRFSAGCQVIWSPEGPWIGTWLRFHERLKDLLLAHGQFIFPYLLTEKLNAEEALT